MTAIQPRIDGVMGYGLPLHPEVLAELNEFEVGHIFSVLQLDGEQEQCAEAAIASVRDGTYGKGSRP